MVVHSGMGFGIGACLACNDGAAGICDKTIGNAFDGRGDVKRLELIASVEAQIADALQILRKPHIFQIDAALYRKITQSFHSIRQIKTFQRLTGECPVKGYLYGYSIYRLRDHQMICMVRVHLDYLSICARIN